MQPRRTSGWRFTLKRASGFFRLLFRSKMAIFGLVLIGLFAIMSLGASLVTPYDPQRDIVAGSYAVPSWLSYFSGGSELSQNVILEPNLGFPTLTSFQSWQFQTADSHLTIAFDPDTTFSPGTGSARITLDGSSPAGSHTATLMKSISWPYNGAPDTFTASIEVLPATASASEPVRATPFIERLSDGERWNLTSSVFEKNPSWIRYPLVNQTWQTPAGGINSRSQALQSLLGSSVSPAQLIFSSKDNYAYGVIVTISSPGPGQPQEVFLDDLNLKLFGTSWGILGTDNIGHDVFSQLVWGSRVSLMVGLLAAGIGISLGLLVGLLAGYMGRLVDEVLMRFTDMLLVIPGLPLLIVLVAVLGSSFGSSRLVVLIIVIGFLGWMGFARVVRSQVLSLKERPFVEAAKAAGAGPGHVMTRHILPNVVGLIYVNLALAVPASILTEAALSFLGLGDTTVQSWGRMLHDVEVENATKIWWWVIPPGIAIALISLSFVLIGYALDDIFNPRLRQRR